MLTSPSNIWIKTTNCLFLIVIFITYLESVFYLYNNGNINKIFLEMIDSKLWYFSLLLFLFCGSVGKNNGWYLIFSEVSILHFFCQYTISTIISVLFISVMLWLVNLLFAAVTAWFSYQFLLEMIKWNRSSLIAKKQYKVLKIY